VESVGDGAGGADAVEDDWVRVCDAEGREIGRGWLSPASALRVRIVVRPPDERGEDDVVAERVEAAVALRRRLFPDASRTDAFRLVHAEGDGLPGLVVDRFGPILVAQFSTRPLHRRRERLAAVLLRATAPSGVTTLVSRPGGKEEEEGIEDGAAPIAVGAPPPEAVGVVEDGMRLEVDLRRGQKTGHYADQRENRRHVAEVAAGEDVLDAYAGSGGFAIRALLGGARSALAVDSSGPALAAARRNAEHNGVAARLETAEADVGERLDALARQRRRFGVVVCDPPRFATSRAGLERALLAYRAVNAKAIARVEPGGFLAAFSCSGAVDPETFADTIRAATRDVARRATVLRTLAAGPDHPVSLAAPEGRYLTGVLLRIEP
jgi:23S rRNA (cytosine1962-C5)-methyltransferase